MYPPKYRSPPPDKIFPIVLSVSSLSKECWKSSPFSQLIKLYALQMTPRLDFYSMWLVVRPVNIGVDEA